MKNIHVLLLSCVSISSTLAMVQIEDSALHKAAKANNYQACFALLTRMPFETIQLPSRELLESVRNASIADVFEDPASKQLAKHMYEQTDVANKERIKRALLLRTACNAQGMIPRECCDNTNEKLCQLLDPSQNDMFILDRSPTFKEGEGFNFLGQNYTCQQVKRLYNPEADK